MGISVNTKDYDVVGKRQQILASIAMDSSYSYGGEAFDPNVLFGLPAGPVSLILPENPAGYVFKYDYTNKKMRVFAPAPLVVFEEVVTMTAGTTYDTGTTKYPMAWPIYASNANQALGLLPKGLNPVTKTISIDMQSGTPGTRATITSLDADSYTTITISYITQAWKEVFDNLVEGETMAAGATTTNGITFTAGTPDTISFISVGTGFLCGLMVGLKLSTTVSAPKPCQKGETTVAGEYALDWTNTSPAATTMSVVTTANWDAATATIVFNYLKKPAAGFLYDRFIEEDSAASSSQVYTHAASAALVKQPLLWSTPGFMPSVTLSTTSATWPIGGIGMTVGSTTQWQPTNWYQKTKAVTAGTWTSGTGVAASLTVKPTYLWGLPEDVQTKVPLEIPDGTNLSALNDVKLLILSE
jgi:hypothetical protein